ncbi:hypothetical protein [Lichenihabitans sp. PAMC28606]|nr:hypothetical protein [Lichenihabitans sp. PAMC28606]
MSLRKRLVVLIGSVFLAVIASDNARATRDCGVQPCLGWQLVDGL